MEELEKWEKDKEYIKNLLKEIEENGLAVINIDGGEIIKNVIDDLEKSVEFNYDCYQDAGKKMFEYAETIDKAKEFIDKILSNGNGANCGDLQMLLDILGEE